MRVQKRFGCWLLCATTLLGSSALAQGGSASAASQDLPDELRTDLSALLQAGDPVTITATAQDREVHERWGRPGTFVVRRTGGTGPVRVNYFLGGTSQRGVDYTTRSGNFIDMPSGVNEVFVQVFPREDRFIERPETIGFQIAPGTGYTVGSPASTTIRLNDWTERPTEEEAARFLIQAAYGADRETLNEVTRLGFQGWLKQQFSAPIGRTQPYITARIAAGLDTWHDQTKISIWQQVMKKRAGSSGPPPDALRQRVGYSLSQIFVVSQNMDALLVNSEGVANYYDGLMEHGLGNFRNLLEWVTMHPCMGMYLSHVGNRKANPQYNIFPDENFAREVMQLFTIGLWELNQDGTRKLVNGQPVPTYNNDHIRAFARCFTGFAFGGPNNNQFYWPQWEFRHPMKLYDIEHDLAPKTLLGGVTTPARAASDPDTGAAARADVKAALDNLFMHPNVGPFIGKQLIQRMVTSNPSPAYVSRVAAAFNNNGLGVRGDMQAVVRAILLDPEARRFEASQSSTFGKKREPYMVLWNLAKTFDAKAQSGKWDAISWMYDAILQEPLQSPSVFNFYSPSFRPFGEMTEQGLVGPEFQIMTAVTTLEALNMSLRGPDWGISRWIVEPPDRIVMALTDEQALAHDPDALVRSLASRMVGAPLNPRTFEIIRKAIAAMPAEGDGWRRARTTLAVYLTASSPEFNILR